MATFHEHNIQLRPTPTHRHRIVLSAGCSPNRSPTRRHGFDDDNFEPPRRSFGFTPGFRGLPQDWGSGGDRDWRGWIVGGLEFLSEAGTERAIVDGATNLEQQIGAASRPPHLL